MATDALARMRSDETTTAIRETARGVVLHKAQKKYLAAARAAALIAIGRRRDPAAKEILESALEDVDPLIRLAATNGLRQLLNEQTASALIETLRTEENEAVLIAVTRTLAAVIDNEEAAGKTAAAQAAVKAVLVALGRKTWRADLELVGFLGRFPSVAAVPALIDQLARFVDHPELIASGELSGLLRSRVHATLVGFIGRPIPVRRVDLWREFWEREKATFGLVASMTGPHRR